MRLKLISALILLALPVTAYAYLDPELQLLPVIIGVAAAFVVTIKLYWKRLMARFSKDSSEEQSDDQEKKKDARDI